jgi:hypothetical protein
MFSQDRLDEARAINKSLSALGDVVAALTAGESFVPYRNHKLTQLMSDSLGGNAKTLMVVNVSPLASDAAETKNSLDYASRVKQVRASPQVLMCNQYLSLLIVIDRVVIVVHRFYVSKIYSRIYDIYY